MINSASSLATRLLSISVLIWLQQYLLKRISPEEYSLLPVLYSVMMFAPLLTTILTGGLGRYIVEAYAKDDDKRVTQIVSTMFPILCTTGLFFLVGGWTFAWHIDKILTIDPKYVWDARVMMALLMASTAIRLPLSPFGVGLYVRQKFVLANLIAVGVEVFRLSLLFGLLFGVSTRVLWVVSASVCAELASLLVTTALSRRLVPALRFSLSRVYWPIARELTSFGGWSFVGGLANTVRMAIDPILLNKFSTPLEVAAFNVGTIPQRQLVGFLVALRAPLGPSLIAMHVDNRESSIRNTYLRIGRYAMWGILLLTVPAMVFAHELITLYAGNKYALAAPVLLVSLIALPLGYSNIVAPQLAEAKACIKPWVLRGSVLHTANLALTIYLVVFRDMGALGSAIGTSAVEVVLGPALLWTYGIRIAGTTFSEFSTSVLLPGLLPGTFAGLTLIIIKYTYAPTTWFDLFLAGVTGTIVYLAVLYSTLLRTDRGLIDFVKLKLQSMVKATQSNS